ncbi:GspE/PulE family protein [Alcanivorax sp. 1008]|uniref:GspE/PulE family protein n=1 Tax=Alcanivorax sp. 1008 TaxID=2816853 RepID=UPI001D7C4765|nr:ATPase, T2SS/T4P/T4SS family [Alcanivorax sp. 1008]MCC1496720.1 Flp pilus assembly complex ATPase component TadA [Alcanivorax sp. 1008]
MSSPAVVISEDKLPRIRGLVKGAASAIKPDVSRLIALLELVSDGGDEKKAAVTMVAESLMAAKKDEVKAAAGILRQRFGSEYRFVTPLIVRDHLFKQVLERASVVATDEEDSKEGIQLDTGAQTRAFETIMTKAVQLKVTDVHIKISPAESRVAFRIFKQLEVQPFGHSEKDLTDIVTSAYNHLAIPSSRSGQFSSTKRMSCMIERKIAGEMYRFRYQHAPIEPKGVEVVMRLLPMSEKEAKALSFEQLGYSDTHAKLIRKATARPDGAVLVAGTTGSGKTTTLKHGIMGVMERRPGISVRTVEDPVEYIIPGASQTSVIRNDSDDASGAREFAQTIRAIMRMDPDIIMIGEIRDKDSADLGVKAVLSGHQVMSTTHAASVLDAISRLIDLGVERRTIASPNFLGGLIYQRLVPVLCSSCKIKYQKGMKVAGRREFEKRMEPVNTPGSTIYIKGPGCVDCSQRGIVGITVCAEVMTPDDEFLDLISKGEDIGAKRHWREQKTPDPFDCVGAPAYYHAILKMRAGMISPEDVEDNFGLFESDTIAEMYAKYGFNAVNETHPNVSVVGGHPARNTSAE